MSRPPGRTIGRRHPPVSHMRILVAHNHYRQPGGEDAVVQAEIALLRSHGHEVEFFSKHNDHLQEDRRVAMAAGAVWSSKAFDEITVAIARFSPDVMHVHNTFPMLSPAIYHAACKQGVPVVQTLHNFRLFCLSATFLREGRVCEDCLGRMPWRGVIRGCYRGSRAQSGVLATTLAVHRAMGTFRTRVRRYIALNEFCRAKFIEGGLPRDRIVVKPNFVEAAALSDGPRRGALFVGRLSREKGAATLGRAVQGTDLEIDVLGDGPDRGDLSEVKGIRLRGAAAPSVVRHYMERAACLVMPSIWYENFPRTLVEAFAAGLPVIASRIGALAELVTHGETGLLVEAGSESGLREALRWAATHPAELERMGRNARAVYERYYTPEMNYRTLMEIYDQARG